MKERILIIGACGQIGVELTCALRSRYGTENVLAADIRTEPSLLIAEGPYLQLNVLDQEALRQVVRQYGITQIYLLAAVLSARGEQNPLSGWDINMKGLLHVLETARLENVRQIFWPSSIAVFGPDAPRENCPQQTIIEPTTVYGISKYAGECWCRYYHEKYGLDIRSIRYPGLISYSAEAGGGTTDYAVDIFHHALTSGHYTCYLKADTLLPMMYMEDAIRATIELMEAPAEKLLTGMSYNLAGFSFTPAELCAAIREHVPHFTIDYAPDQRQQIADAWPGSIDDSQARHEWGWKPQYDLEKMVAEMMLQLQLQLA